MIATTAPFADPTFFTWVDPDPKTPPIAKLHAALDAYRAKYEQTPPEVRVYSYDQAGYGFEPLRIDGERIAVVADIHVPRHSIYIAAPTKEDHETMSTATAEATNDSNVRVIRGGRSREDAASIAYDSVKSGLVEKVVEKVRTKQDVTDHAAQALTDALEEKRAKHTVTVSAGGESVTLTGEQFKQAVKGDTTVVLHPPSEMSFFGADFLADPHLQTLADTLCTRHDLPATDHVTVLWKRKGGRSGGKAVLGKCVASSSGLLGFYRHGDFHVWIAADHVRAMQLTPTQLEALIFHELSHVGIECDEETGECKRTLVAHDFAGFLSELDLYGAWMDDLGTAKAAFEQASLL